MLLKTGFGLLIKNGKKLKKFILTPGEHPDPIGYTFQEVGNREELEKIVLDKSDEQVAWEESCKTRMSLVESAKKKLENLGITTEEFNALFGV